MSRRLTLLPALLAAGALVLTACGDQVPGGMPEEGQQSDQVDVAEGAVDGENGAAGGTPVDDGVDDGDGGLDDDGLDDGGLDGGDDGLDGAAPEDPIVVQIGEDEFETNMAIYRRYDEAKGGPLALLAPAASADDLADGKTQEYRDGSIFWSPDTGAQIVRGQILATYLENGGPTGRLGWPVGDETETGEAVFSDFQHGQIRFEDDSIHVIEGEDEGEG